MVRSDGPATSGKSRLLGPLALLLTTVLVGTAVAATTTLYLRIRCAPLRSEPSFTEGDSKATVFLNQPVEVVERSKDKDWVKKYILTWETWYGTRMK